MEIINLATSSKCDRDCDGHEVNVHWDHQPPYSPESASKITTDERKGALPKRPLAKHRENVTAEENTTTPTSFGDDRLTMRNRLNIISQGAGLPTSLARLNISHSTGPSAATADSKLKSSFAESIPLSDQHAGPGIKLGWIFESPNHRRTRIERSINWVDSLFTHDITGVANQRRRLDGFSA